MLKKKNGFSMIEVLVASSLFFHFLVIFIPIQMDIEFAKQQLNDRRFAAQELHAQLQALIYSSETSLPPSFELTQNENSFLYTFTPEGHYIKGCVEWVHDKQPKESICLFGIHQG